jgi:hypothetical protein
LRQIKAQNLTARQRSFQRSRERGDIVNVEHARPDVREVVGVFGDSTTFQAAVDDLLNSGFDRAGPSLL